MSVVPAETPPSLRPLNPAALDFVSCSQASSEFDASEAAGSPVQRCGSPDSVALHSRSQHLPEGIPVMEEGQHHEEAAPGGAGEEAGLDVIPAPAPRPGLARQRSSSSSSLHRSGSASPPLPALPHPGMVPTYGWAAPYPMYHVYPAAPHSDGPLERAASPPGVFPAGGSPPLPTGFISVPLQGLGDPGSPTARHGYGASPPPYGASPPYGSSPPPYGSSPPGMAVFMPGPPPMMHHPHGGEYGMQHPGYGVPHHPTHAHHHLRPHPHPPPPHDVVQHMAGLAVGQPQAAPPQQQPRGSSPGPGSAGGGGRSEGRASARIARSHRAGGAYDPAEYEFDLAEAEAGGEGARRTVMIRNIPNKYTQAQMLSVLHKSGFSGAFDFLYLPIDFRNKCNLGYCFLNLLTPAHAARLYRQFHAKRWEEHNSRKVCEVTYGRVQGRDTLVQHFRASKFPGPDAEFMPLVFTRVEGGVASHPVPIHEYIDGLEAAGGEGGAEAAHENGRE